MRHCTLVHILILHHADTVRNILHRNCVGGVSLRAMGVRMSKPLCICHVGSLPVQRTFTRVFCMPQPGL